MNHTICDSCETVNHCRKHGCIPLQPAQQEPPTWMKDCADFWEHYTRISEASQENYKAEAQMWLEKLRT